MIKLKTTLDIFEQRDFLLERLESLETAITQYELLLKRDNWESDAFIKQSLSKALTDSAAVRRKLAELSI